MALKCSRNIDPRHHLAQGQANEVRFGFCAPDDRLASLSLPAEGQFGERHPSLSFDIEFSQEEPDMITISLLDLDQDSFIHTLHRTVQFPARLLADLLSRRMATAEEAEAWQATDGEE